MAGATHTGVTSPAEVTGQTKFETDPRAAGGLLIEDGMEFDPQETEGFLPEEAEIAGVTVLGEDSYRGRRTEVFDYAMTDGTHYHVHSSEPNDLRSDIGVVSTTPWTTRAGGFNAKNMAALNAIGYQTDFVEPRGKAIGASLLDSARNLELIVADRHSKTDVRPDETLYFGASRAAAIGLGVRSAVYAELLAPCFPSGCKTEQLPKVATQLCIEALELGKHMARLGFGSVSKQRSTFSRHPMDTVHNLLAIPRLINGDAGKMAWANPDTPVHITLLDKDGWSQIKVWEQMAKELSNLRISQIRGRHLGLAHPDIIGAAIDRFDALAEMRGLDGEFNDEIFAKLLEIQPPEPQRSLGDLSVGTLIKAGFALAG